MVAGDAGALLRMPVTSPEANHLERQTEVSLAPDGSITAIVQEHAAGQAAADFRREFRNLSRPDYTKMIEGWVTRGATGARVTKVEPKDNNGDASFALNVEFTAPAYGQLMQNRLLVFKTANRPAARIPLPDPSQSPPPGHPRTLCLHRNRARPPARRIRRGRTA